MRLGSLREEVVNGARTTGNLAGGVGCEGKDEDDDDNHDGMDLSKDECCGQGAGDFTYVVCEECGLDSPSVKVCQDGPAVSSRDPSYPNKV